MRIPYILLIIVHLINAQAPALLRCKDNYMHEMQTLLKEDGSKAGEWSLNLVTPLQSLFSDGENADIYKRLELACVAHSNFIGCLQSCPKSKARSIIEQGQTNWAHICQAVRHNKEFQSTILPCWTKHGEFIASQCHFHSMMLQNSVVDLMRVGWQNEPDMYLEEICRTLSLYDKCYIGHSDKVCGRHGWKFLLNLHAKNSHALLKLLIENIDIKTLPPMCNQWRFPEEYAEWHEQKIAEAHRSRSAQPELPTFLLFIISFLWKHMD